MGSSRGGSSEEQRRRLLAELKGLFGIAFGPGVEAFGRSFAERISQDGVFRAEARERFERGRAWGGFPELSALLSGMTPEEQDEFFETGWTRVALPPASSGPPENPWDRAPWEGDAEAYREDLYAGMAFGFSDFRAFAREWLEGHLYLSMPKAQPSSISAGNGETQRSLPSLARTIKNGGSRCLWRPSGLQRTSLTTTRRTGCFAAPSSTNRPLIRQRGRTERPRTANSARHRPERSICALMLLIQELLVVRWRLALV